MNNRKAIIIGVLLAGLASVAWVGHGIAVEHTRYIMGGVEGHVATPTNCIPCHIEGGKNFITENFLDRQYRSPIDIAVSPDGRRLYVTAQESGQLLIVDAGLGRVTGEIPLGKHPHSVILSPDGKTAYVSIQWANTIAVIDLASEEIISELTPGAGPAGMALGPDGRRLYVANNFSNDISVIDLESAMEIRRLAGGQSPYAVALSPGGKAIYVTNKLTNPKPYRTPPVTEVTVIDTRTLRVVERKIFNSAHVLESVDFTPSGDWAMVTLIRPKNLLPATQVNRGWMITNGFGIIERKAGGRVIQLLLDQPNAYYADPYDILVTPDGKRAFVSHAGVDKISVIDLDSLRELVASASDDDLAIYANHLGISRRYVIKRIPTGSNPKGLALSPDGQRLYVAERLADRISVIDVARLEVTGVIDLGGPEKITITRRGRRLFHNAGFTYQNQYSCRSCHPDEHEDALVYDLEPDGLGRNLLNNRSLRDIGRTLPYKWNGKNTSLYMMDGIRFAKWLTRTNPFPPRELQSLVAFITRKIEQPPNRFRSANGRLTAAQLRGKAIFERSVTNSGTPIPPKSRCVTCHPAPYYTDARKTDVGTLAELDASPQFDNPHLVNIHASPPYLHDGRAQTLEEIWTRFNPNDQHGIANDLTKEQLNDLIEYLRSL